MEFDLWENLELLECLDSPSCVLMEMSNIRGNDIKVNPYSNVRLPFSFYFSNKEVVHNIHGIRVKLIWNPSKAPANADGYMELHGNYDYVSGSHKYKPTADELKIARDFFKYYKVLFAAVWEAKLYDNYLIDYFRGLITFKELLSKFENVSEKNYYLINHCNNVEELTRLIREKRIFNLCE